MVREAARTQPFQEQGTVLLDEGLLKPDDIRREFIEPGGNRPHAFRPVRGESVGIGDVVGDEL